MGEPLAPLAIVGGIWDADGCPDANSARLVQAVADTGRHELAVVGVDLSGRAASSARGEDPVDGLTALVTQRAAALVVLAADALGEDLAPRLAVRVGGVAALDVRRLRWEGPGADPSATEGADPADGAATGWRFARAAFGGAVEIGHRVPADTVVVVTVDPHAVGSADGGGAVATDARAGEASEAGDVELVALPGSVPGPVRRLAAAPASGDRPLTEARRIVAGGRGLGGPEGFEELAVLARALDAELAASRPPCDAGWVPGRYQVGITGARVAPELYLAVAISGSIQHLAGMKDARQIVAVNADPAAPIFRYADLGVVGDWREVTAGMLEVLGSSDDADPVEPADGQIADGVEHLEHPIPPSSPPDPVAHTTGQATR
jgi:electron transfer flavoprotein alpha subunit